MELQKTFSVLGGPLIDGVSRVGRQMCDERHKEKPFPGKQSKNVLI